MKKLLSILLVVCGLSLSAQTTQTISSPNQNLKLKVDLSGERIRYSISDGQGEIMNLSEAYMELGDGTVLGSEPLRSLRKGGRRSVDRMVASPLYRKDSIHERYNELYLQYKSGYSIVFRVYDNGVAYRFETAFKNPITVKNEGVKLGFADDFPALVPYVNRERKENEPLDVFYETSFENTYTHFQHLSEMDPNHLAFLPLMVELPHGRKVVIAESDLRDYPGMYMRLYLPSMLEGIFAPLPKKWEQGGHNNLQYRVKEREDCIAKTAGTRTFPWRIIAVSQEDKELVDNDLVYLLAAPSQVEDISWIKPGKVAWDWWNNWNIWGVDFKAGINNDTYKYYIDFASKNGIEYVILDEGWAVNKQADLFQVVPEINLEELVAYANERNVGLVLWAGYVAIDRDMEHVCKHYSEMGIKGFKVDFMDRDDQKVVDFYYRMAAMAAKYHLFVDFHGAYKPTGLSRTYPNVLNFEGVYGLEQSKWDDDLNQVNYECMIPYIRMVAGNLDYTQGAMDNATQYHFRAIYTNPMSQGTRCRQLAEYVIFESPFNMLCDSPTKYMQNQECVDFIASVPTVWDETIALDGKLGEYAVIARRKGNTWYIGGITNWKPRRVRIDLSKLGINAHSVKMYVDGPNANRNAEDYKITEKEIKDNKIGIEMKSGGGAVIIVKN